MSLDNGCIIDWSEVDLKKRTGCVPIIKGFHIDIHMFWRQFVVVAVNSNLQLTPESIQLINAMLPFHEWYPLMSRIRSAHRIPWRTANKRRMQSNYKGHRSYSQRIIHAWSFSEDACGPYARGNNVTSISARNIDTFQHNSRLIASITHALTSLQTNMPRAINNIRNWPFHQSNGAYHTA